MKKMLELSLSYKEEKAHPSVLACSSLENDGIDEIWGKIENFISQQKDQKQFLERRKKQSKFWFEEELVWCLKEEMTRNPRVKNLLAPLR